LRAAGGATSLPAGGLALGIEAGIRYLAARPVELESGDVLLWYTDGLVEARNAGGDLFGIERVESTLRASAGATSRELIERLRAEVGRFVGGDGFEDDLTLVVLRAT